MPIVKLYFILLFVLCGLCLALPMTGCLPGQQDQQDIAEATAGLRALTIRITELERKLMADIRAGAISPDTIAMAISEISAMKDEALILTDQIKDIKKNGVTWSELIWGAVIAFLTGNGSALGAGMVKRRVGNAITNAANNAANGGTSGGGP